MTASASGGFAPEGGAGARTADGGSGTGAGTQAATGGTGAAGGQTAEGGNAGSGGGSGSGAAAGPCLVFGQPEKIGDIESTALRELSGLVASRTQPGVYYAHADSGDGARLVAIDDTGRTLASLTLAGVTAIDWEDIAWGPGPDGSGVLLVGDIGDNAARTGTGTPRSEIQVYRLPEPEISTLQPGGEQTVSGAQRLRFTYPDQAHDAEVLMVDPITGDIVIVTKETSGASLVFRAPADTPPEQPTRLEAIATLSFGTPGANSALVTAGDISPSGDRIILRTYTAIWLWSRPAGTTLAQALSAVPTELPSPVEPQGEGLTFSADGRAWLSAGEQDSSLYQGLEACP